ncbi:MAG: TonB-dependent receptor domain-containing protein [Bryobacteraceae bacterium]
MSLQKLTARMACLLLLAWVAPAQTVQGVVTGTVSDPTGGSIPNAEVTLTNEGTQVTQSATAGADGGYRFSLVPPGTYTLTVKAPGFGGKETKGIIVNASQTVPLDVKLDVATASTAIEVTTQNTIVQTASSTLATTVNAQTIANTALLTRNVFDLAFLAPQVSQGMNFGPAAGGARESGTVFLMNGADNNDNFSEGLPNVVPPLESVAEFSILTNQFSSEYGRGSGAVVSAVQKTGTNAFHGAAYEFHRDRTIGSNDFFSNRGDQPKPKFIRNQFGGEIDGPIKKDKTFFSFAFDRYDVRTGSNLQIQVPTGAELAAMSAGAGPIASSYLSKYPLRTSEIPCPNEPAEAFGHIGCFNTFDSIPTTQNTYFARIDQNFSTSDRLSVTANVQRYTNVDTFGQNTGSAASATVQPFAATDLENYHQIVLVETHTFSPTLVNEFTAGHNRHFSDLFEGNGNFTDPEILIDGANFGSFGFNIGPNSEAVVEAFTQDRWQVQDALGWTLGKHSIKIGGGWQYAQLYRNWDLGGPGQYEFANTTGAATAPLNPDGTIGNPDSGINYTDSNFQHDFPYLQEIAVDPTTGAKANAYRHYIGEDANAFVNDDWKVSRNLTLNLGLRWEHFGAPRETRGVLSQFTNLTCLSVDCIANARVGPVSTMWKPRWTDFAPRVGFAWDVRGDGKTSIRGGYGIFFDRIFDNVWSNGAWNPPFYALVDHDATGAAT